MNIINFIFIININSWNIQTSFISVAVIIKNYLQIYLIVKRILIISDRYAFKKYQSFSLVIIISELLLLRIYYQFYDNEND